MIQKDVPPLLVSSQISCSPPPPASGILSKTWMLFQVQTLKEQLGFAPPGAGEWLGRGGGPRARGWALPLPSPPPVERAESLGSALGGGDGVSAARRSRLAGSGLRGCAGTRAVTAEPAGVRIRAEPGLGPGIGLLSVLAPLLSSGSHSRGAVPLGFSLPQHSVSPVSPLPPSHPSRDFNPPRGLRPPLGFPSPAPIPSGCPFP